MWHFANNNGTTTLAVVADALVSSLRVAAVSPLSVAVWARRCLTLDRGRPFDERRFEFCQHQLLGLGCVFEPLFQVRDASIAHEIVLMLLVRPARENSEIGGIA